MAIGSILDSLCRKRGRGNGNEEQRKGKGKQKMSSIIVLEICVQSITLTDKPQKVLNIDSCMV